MIVAFPELYVLVIIGEALAAGKFAELSNSTGGTGDIDAEFIDQLATVIGRGDDQ
jgi:hypothetical protein